jgi:hypothetical protein
LFEELPQGISVPGAEIQGEFGIGNKGFSFFGGYGTNGREHQGWFGGVWRW